MKVEPRVAAIVLPSVADLHRWVCSQADHAIVAETAGVAGTLLGRYLAEQYPELAFDVLSLRRGVGYIVVWQAHPRRRLGALELPLDLAALDQASQVISPRDLPGVLTRAEALVLFEVA